MGLVADESLLKNDFLGEIALLLCIIYVSFCIYIKERKKEGKKTTEIDIPEISLHGESRSERLQSRSIYLPTHLFMYSFD